MGARVVGALSDCPQDAATRRLRSTSWIATIEGYDDAPNWRERVRTRAIKSKGGALSVNFRRRRLLLEGLVAAAQRRELGNRREQQLIPRA